MLPLKDWVSPPPSSSSSPLRSADGFCLRSPHAVAQHFAGKNASHSRPGPTVNRKSAAARADQAHQGSQQPCPESENNTRPFGTFHFFFHHAEPPPPDQAVICPELSQLTAAGTLYLHLAPPGRISPICPRNEFSAAAAFAGNQDREYYLTLPKGNAEEEGEQLRSAVHPHLPLSFPHHASSTPFNPTWLTPRRPDFLAPGTSRPFLRLFSSFLQREPSISSAQLPPFCGRLRRRHPGFAHSPPGVPRRQARCRLHKRSDLNSTRLAAVHRPPAPTRPDQPLLASTSFLDFELSATTPAKLLLDLLCYHHAN